MIRRLSPYASVAVLFLVLSVTTPLRGQLILPSQGETLPTFEVATIKPSRSDLGRSFHTSIWWNDNTWSTENLTLRELIRFAFHASPAQITGGPDALLDSRFDISAKIGEEDYAALKTLPDEQRERQVQLMIQALLADRFGIHYHMETRTLPVFDLVVDKSGAKLQPWKPGPSEPAAAVTDPPAATTPDSKHLPATPPAKASQSFRATISRDHATMTVTGQPLSNSLRMISHQPELDGRPVIDKTGLDGLYSFTLNWSPQRLNAVPSPDATGPSLFSALREQLGLRLEAAKAPIPVVVIDAISPPSPN